MLPFIPFPGQHRGQDSAPVPGLYSAVSLPGYARQYGDSYHVDTMLLVWSTESQSDEGIRSLLQLQKGSLAYNKTILGRYRHNKRRCNISKRVRWVVCQTMAAYLNIEQDA
jgi:hypothetical protein